jgi:hypothetical protein
MNTINRISIEYIDFYEGKLFYETKRNVPLFHHLFHEK